MALLDGTADEQTALQYKAIIHFKAAVIFHTYHAFTSDASSLNKSVQDQIMENLHASLAALDSIKFLTQPSLSLLQALLTGVIVMEVLGDIPGRSALTVSAARTLVALGYHHHVKVISETEDIEEVHACIAWCYLFEKNTSMLLMRPQTLPKLPVPATSYIPSDSSNPMTEFMELSLGIAQAQEAALDLIFAGDQNDNSTWRTEINSILRHMETINSSITSHLASLTDQTDIYVQMHWYILEFTYYSIFTTIIRMDPNMASDHARGKVCLRSARQALECLCKIEASLPGRKDSTQLYLTWAIVSYPLTPLFVVFCNVVCTANLHDFRLLQRTSNALLPIIGANKYIDRLSKLCITLIAMCKPLVDKTLSSSAQASGAPARRVSSDNDQFADGVSRTSIITDPLDVDLRNGAESLETQSTEEYHFIPGTYDEQGGCFPGSADPSWDDQMMWQLFCTAPSVCWYNADMLDTIRDSSDVFGSS
ncbi:hypothetical protein COH21_012829 [Aspergillus flavus]|nr:hypothetical protein COH21_012829 [Aspergillus flavus]